MPVLPTAVPLEVSAWVAAVLAVGEGRGRAAGQFVAEVLLKAGSEDVVVIKVEYVHSIGDGQGLIAADDHEVIVVTVGRFIPEVVASGDDDAVFGVAGVDDDDLVVDDGVPGAEQLGTCQAGRSTYLWS
jgi:hypothetical protein